MRILSIFLLLSSVSWGQPHWSEQNMLRELLGPLVPQILAPIFSPGDPAPQGTSFTESFGDAGANPCGFGGYTGCDGQWAIYSSFSASIIPTKAGAPKGSGGYSLHVDANAVSTPYMEMAGFVPNIPSGTAWTLTMSLYYSSSTSAYHLNLISPVEYHGSPHHSCAIWWQGVGTVEGHGTGGTTSTATSLSVGWHTLILTCNGASSSLVVDGGTPATFTAGAYDGIFWAFGSSAGVENATYDVGYFKVDSSVGMSGTAENMYVPSETSANTPVAADGTQVTASLMQSSTYGASGGPWVFAGTHPEVMTFQSGCSHAPLTPRAFGPMIFSLSSTGIQLDTSVVYAAYYVYPWASTVNSTAASVGFWYKTTIPTSATGYYESSNIAGGVDFASLMVGTDTSGPRETMYLEVHGHENDAPLTGTYFNYVPNTWYWITMQFVKQGTHSLNIYDETGALLSAQTKTAYATGGNPTQFLYGRDGDTGLASATMCFDGLVIDYLHGHFPILP